MAGKASTENVERTALLDGFHEAEPVGSVVLSMDGAEMTLPLTRRTFSSGSEGFHGQVKLVGADGRRYQVGITATLIGSKPA